MVAFFSRMVVQAKTTYPTATREEILFLMGDRWGLPLVPWVHHPCRASPAKKQDHGIAMMCFVTSADVEIDPL
jgi:hypothetical protein